MTTHQQLQQIESQLAAQGADKLRLELVRRARIFKRSWVDMAEALLQVRSQELYLEWGYKDFHSYCSVELLLTKPTVDKLTGNYSVLQRHAPDVLERDGLAQPVPRLDAVEYFAKALRTVEDEESPYLPPGDDALAELRSAVFDDVAPVEVIRRTFNPIVYAKPEGAEAVELLERTRTAARKLEGLLRRAESLDPDRRRALGASLAALLQELDEQIPDAKSSLSREMAG